MSHPQQILERAGLMEHVGSCFKLFVDWTIDAEPHPGHVGDGSQLEFCRTCKGMHNLGSCVICDFCDDLHHTSCVHVNPQGILQSWMCKTCRWMRGMTTVSTLDRASQSISDGDEIDSDDCDIEEERRKRKRKMDMKRPRAPVRIGPQYQHPVPHWQGPPPPSHSQTIDRRHFQNYVPLSPEEIRKDLKRIEEKERDKWLQDAEEDRNVPPEEPGAMWLKQRSALQG